MENNKTFEITDLAGENLENVRWHGYMTVYAIVSTTGGHVVTTEVDYERETNPKWDTPINFTLHEPSIHNNELYLNIQFFCDRTFKSDKYIAGFSIPVKQLFDEISGNVKSPRAVRYPVVNSAGREKGGVKFSYKFGELPKPTSQLQQLSLSSAQPKPPLRLPPQQRPPSQSPQPPSSQQPQPSQRPKRQPQSPELPSPQQQLSSQSPQPPSSQQPRPPQRPKRQPQSPEQPPPQETRPSSQSTQQPRPRPRPQQQGSSPQPQPASGQQLRPQKPRPPPRPQQQQYPQQSRPPPGRPQQRPYPQQARPPPPRPRPPPQSTQNAAVFRAQFVATGQVQVPLSENSPNPHENPTEPALDNHIDQLNISVEAQYGIDPDRDNNIPGDNQFEYPENEAYGQMSAPEYENNENNHNRDEYQDNEESYGNNEEGYRYDGVDNGEDYGDGEEVVEEGYQDDGVNNGEDYGGGEENYDDEEGYEDEGNEEDDDGEEEEG
ncbi:uncharacterized protein LOC130773391 [Actinidia eriantha]|uniref:uncharacterized protein LOC130773391 n=1 Tax=Actinidia eriantha TaxID=165200 RepID=UPI0025827722|nr:uncharacterized protein LOC130773391 [Actinidia eriantha]